MSIQNARHVDTSRAGDNQGGGLYDNLKEYLDRTKVKDGAYVEGSIAVNGQHVLLNSDHVAGNIALGVDSIRTDGGVVAAQLAGVVGTAGIAAVYNSKNQCVNQCALRDAATNDPIVDAEGRTVYALLQADVGVTDGDAIAAAGAENLQVSFVSVSANGTYTLVSVTGDVEISYPRLYAERHLPSGMRQGSPVAQEVVATQPRPLVRKFKVTSFYAAGEGIDLLTGDGTGTGTATVTGDTISSIGPNATAFINDNRSRIRVNGEQLTKGDEVLYDATTTVHFVFALDPGDSFEVEGAAEI